MALTKCMIIKIGKVVFVHGGIDIGLILKERKFIYKEKASKLEKSIKNMIKI